MEVTKKSETMKQLTMKYDEFSLTLNEEDILSSATPDDCDGNKDEVARKDYVQEQLRGLSTKQLRKVLNNMDIEYDENDREEIESLVVWDAACWLKADLTGSLYSNKVIN